MQGKCTELALYWRLCNTRATGGRSPSPCNAGQAAQARVLMAPGRGRVPAQTGRCVLTKIDEEAH